MTMTSLQTLAAEVLAMFHQSTRTDGSKFWTYDHSDDRQWVQDICLEAHGDMSPDDWRYAFIVESLDALSENDDPEDINLEADIYVSELAKWLGSHGHRPGYCDEAMEEEGLSFTTTVDLMQAGQLRETREVFDSIRSSLEARAEATEDDSEEQD